MERTTPCEKSNSNREKIVINRRLISKEKHINRITIIVVKK
jgi:hypothetical protein